MYIFFFFPLKYLIPIFPPSFVYSHLFRRVRPQLKPYYMDFVTELPKSPNQSAVRGLNLLFLLVQNRLAEFHSELELMGDTERADACVVFPVRLEQYLMVGSYDQVPCNSVCYLLNP